MAYDLDEQEQLDQLKAWWNKYGTLVVTLLVIATIVHKTHAVAFKIVSVRDDIFMTVFLINLSFYIKWLRIRRTSSCFASVSTVSVRRFSQLCGSGINRFATVSSISTLWCANVQEHCHASPGRRLICWPIYRASSPTF